MALLRTVSLYWKQEAVSRDAQTVWNEARTFYDRVAKFQEHLHGVGKGLSSAVKAYNRAERSFETRILPSGRKLEELQVPQGGRALEEPAPLDPPREAPALEREAGTEE